MGNAIEYVWGSTDYANRKTREALHVGGCRRRSSIGLNPSTGQHTYAKAEPTCGGAYKCAKCGKLVGWCRGGWEGSVRDDWCDACWCKAERSRR